MLRRSKGVWDAVKNILDVYKRWTGRDETSNVSRLAQRAREIVGRLEGGGPGRRFGLSIAYKAPPESTGGIYEATEILSVTFPSGPDSISTGTERYFYFEARGTISPEAANVSAIIRNLSLPVARNPQDLGLRSPIVIDVSAPDT